MPTIHIDGWSVDAVPIRLKNDFKDLEQLEINIVIPRPGSGSEERKTVALKKEKRLKMTAEPKDDRLVFFNFKINNKTYTVQ